MTLSWLYHDILMTFSWILLTFWISNGLCRFCPCLKRGFLKSHMSRLLENCQTHILIYHCSPLQGKRSYKVGKIRDKSGPYFQQESGPRPLDCRATIHWNISQTTLQQPWHMWLGWTNIKTTFQCMDVLPYRGFCSNYC